MSWWERQFNFIKRRHTWTPTYSANFTLGTLYVNEYWYDGDIIECHIVADGTTNGAPGNIITYTLPVDSIHINSPLFFCDVRDGGAWGDGFTRVSGAVGVADVLMLGRGNFTATAGAGFRAWLRYRWR